MEARAPQVLSHAIWDCGVTRLGRGRRWNPFDSFAGSARSIRGSGKWKCSIRTPPRHATSTGQNFSETAMEASGLEPREPVSCICITDAPTYFRRLMDSPAILLPGSSKIAKVMSGSPHWAGSIVFATTRSRRTPSTKALELSPDGAPWWRAKMEVYGWAPVMA